MTVRRITPDQHTLHRRIRLAALQDAPASFSTSYADAVARPDESWREMTNTCSQGTDGCTFFAFDDSGEAVGMVGGFRDKNDPDAVHLVAMWVAPAARGSGAAGALVEAVFDWAKAIPAKRVVTAVTAGNDLALRLYERMGFAAPTAPLPDVPHVRSCDISLVREL
ncbi:MAG: GNAT family N-acetyltransferase [Akkermansiaceae bacterium]|nr:GNAT family N-acetyltransferase [Armatimonadota bacterium]